MYKLNKKIQSTEIAKARTCNSKFYLMFSFILSYFV